jgi:hypothetical protein
VILQLLALIHLDPITGVARTFHEFVQLHDELVFLLQALDGDIKLFVLVSHLLSETDVNESFLHQVLLILIMQIERVVCILDVIDFGWGILWSLSLGLGILLLEGSLLVDDLQNL